LELSANVKTSRQLINSAACHAALFLFYCDACATACHNVKMRGRQTQHMKLYASVDWLLMREPSIAWFTEQFSPEESHSSDEAYSLMPSTPRHDSR
jgi:hypothetical protein